MGTAYRDQQTLSMYFMHTTIIPLKSEFRILAMKQTDRICEYPSFSFVFSEKIELNLSHKVGEHRLHTLRYIGRFEYLAFASNLLVVMVYNSISE